MKKVSGYVSVRALGCYDFEFYVDDNATDEEIQRKVDERMQLSHNYEVEEGYEEYTEVNYRKRKWEEFSYDYTIEFKEIKGKMLVVL